MSLGVDIIHSGGAFHDPAAGNVRLPAAHPQAAPLNHSGAAIPTDVWSASGAPSCALLLASLGWALVALAGLPEIRFAGLVACFHEHFPDPGASDSRPHHPGLLHLAGVSIAASGLIWIADRRCKLSM